MRQHILLSIAGAAVALSLVGCTSDAPDQRNSEIQEAESQLPVEQELPELEGIPEVVAIVNEREISGDEFSGSYAAQFQELQFQSQLGGVQPDQDELKAQTLDAMINNVLLIQESANQGNTASASDVDEYLEEYAKSSGLDSADELLEQFSNQGSPEERIRQDVQDQILIEQLIENMDVVQPSAQDIEELYEEQTAFVEEEVAQSMPSFEEAKAGLEQQLLSERQNDAITALVEELREVADIEILL